MKNSEAAARVCATGIEAEIRGRLWRLSRPADLETLWEGMADDSRPIPYWVELWPASLALAEFLVDSAGIIKGRRCCDIGCGLGLTALVAASVGAVVAGVDLQPEALQYCRLNAGANAVSPAALVCMDIGSPALARGAFQLAWGGDVIYEKAIFRPFLEFLDLILAKDGVCWIAEPGRGIFHSFKTLACDAGWRLSPLREMKVRAIYEKEPAKPVTIWEMRRRG